MPLSLPPRLAEELRREAERAYPRECCGVLLGVCGGDTRSVRRLVPCVNTRASAPGARYGIAPEDLVRTQREARNERLAILGFYHSHPDQAARPSAADLAEAYWTGCSYLIIAVKEGRAQELASFLLLAEGRDERRLVEEAVAEAETGDAQ